ncbi:MAG: hypothetical protein JRH11_06470 [Deltaproteobacteria bacterium]|nr:hypothetical protein [Deltaproteobacteria bacterium]
MQGPSPLLGYNTNVRHSGKLYHIQTEDSGIRHPHVITHLFADGGRIIATKKTTYGEHVGAEDFQKTVKQLMRAQHKAMFVGLRDGVYDEDETGAVPTAPAPPELIAAVPLDGPTDIEVPGSARASGPASIPAPAPDFAALDAAAASFDDAAGAAARPPSVPSPGLYQSTRSAVEVAGRNPDERSPESIFGNDLLSEKSLDEVILSYLAEDLEDAGEG